MDLDFALKQIFPEIMEIPSLKNPFPKRKRGNRLALSFARQVGEAGFDKEPMVLKLVFGIMNDNNYKIRMDGMLFLKDYLRLGSVHAHSRFQKAYLPELLELLKDEEAYIRIEALDIMTDLLNQFDLNTIETEYIPVVMSTIDINIEEIVQKLA